MPAPAFPRIVNAFRSAPAAGSALIAATTCAAVLISAPVSFVARLTVRSLPDHGERERRVRDAGVHELGGELVAALVAHRERLEHHDLRGGGAGERAGLAGVGEVRRADDRRRLALVARRRVRQRDLLGDVGELRGELVEPRVDLGRVHVVVEEALLEARHVGRELLAEPLRHVGLVDPALVGGDAHAQRRLAGDRLQVPVVHVLAGVGVARRIGLGVLTGQRHREGHGGAEHAVGGGAGHGEVGRGRRGRRAELAVRLDVEELARVVRERVGAHDHDLAGRRDRLGPTLGAARRPVLGVVVGPVLRAQRGAALGLAGVERGSVSDRGADLVAPGAEQRDLVVGDGERRGSVARHVGDVIRGLEGLDHVVRGSRDLDELHLVLDEVLGDRLPTPGQQQADHCRQHQPPSTTHESLRVSIGTYAAHLPRSGQSDHIRRGLCVELAQRRSRRIRAWHWCGFGAR